MIGSIKSIISHIGKYIILLSHTFRKPEKWNTFRKQIFSEIDNMGISSLGIVAIISVFMGAVVTIQTAFAIDSPLIPRYTIGFATRQSTILEFAPTIISIFLAGKIGSRIASEIGTMRTTEQIDALEIMGINTPSFLLFPKIIASVLIFPILAVFSMFLAIFGGWLVGLLTNLLSIEEYIYGLQYSFQMYDVYYAITKVIVFAFLIVTISGYFGYFVRGGAVEVGKSSTKAVVYSSIAIIIFNLILTQLLLI